MPNFYTDYGLIFEIFKDFDIKDIKNIGTYYTHDSQKYESYHWHVLIKNGKLKAPLNGAFFLSFISFFG